MWSGWCQGFVDTLAVDSHSLEEAQMKKRTKVIIGAGVVAAAAAVPAVAVAGGDSDTPITGPALERAKAAALEYTGEGVVTATEVGDEESLYEVEVTLDDGSEVDVQLDENFIVVGAEPEGVDESDNDGDGDD